MATMEVVGLASQKKEQKQKQKQNQKKPDFTYNFSLKFLYQIKNILAILSFLSIYTLLWKFVNNLIYPSNL